MTGFARPRKKTLAIAAAAVVGLSLAGGGAYAAFSPRNTDDVVVASDVIDIAKGDVEEKVLADGEVAANKYTSLTTSLLGPVKDLKVQLGDHVNGEQLLAVMDTVAIERQIELEQASKAAAATANQNQLESAQQQYSQLREQYQQGATPEINAAVAAERQAASSLESAETAFQHRQTDTVAGTDPALREQHLTLQAARDEQRDAALNLVRVNADTIYGVVMTEAGQPGMLADAVATQDRVNRADRDLAEKQKAYEQRLLEVDRELAELQTKVRDASAAHSEAVVAVESARLAALHAIDTQRLAVEQAQETAATGTLASDVTTKHLSLDIAQAEVRSPHGGIITELAATVGAPVEGVLMTVADDSTLKVTTTVKESEVGKIKPGAEVTFTTPAAKDKTYQGTVTHVAPVAQKNETPAESGKAKREFPVEIKVTGEKEGLHLGASTKINIVTKKEIGALTVPREAVLKSPEGHHVIILVPEGEKHRVKKIPVGVGVQTEFDVAITSLDLKAGDKVVSDPGKYAEDVDKLVRIREQ
ncbi:Macrolide export protein MacA [Corynebacterium kalinowskii]|uniref:Macrolide export protein MacA n=1 Tax=Corynebacterium kalinowskii TaxID=2675216 RepID=A0A6B8VBC6_9CORY|nr:HlyD family efflux transporter periplasmic adaptor subunit [Corynebacterium kalinowskii]QGU02452.1 Macrolide export protein MacA [Corynebacterium kalinowskii]